MIELDYPELNPLFFSPRADVSGAAIRLARAPVETKAESYRAHYDDALTRAQMMALTMGGLGRYDGFESFNADSFASGALNHSIGKRPVFVSSAQDDIEFKSAFWGVVKVGVESGAPLETVLRDLGWSDAKLAEFGTQRLAAIALQQEDAVPAENL